MTPEVKREFEEKRIKIEKHISELKTMFEDDCELTVMVRRPGNDMQTTVISTDSVEEIHRVLSVMVDNKKKKVDIYIPKVVLK